MRILFFKLGQLQSQAL